MTDRWELIADGTPRDGAHNMAVDHALLRRAREGVASLRVYGWRPPCLSFGRNEPARARYDVDRIRTLDLHTVRRPTGGRAVWHDREVTYAVAGPARLFGSLAEAYLAIHCTLAAALRRLGVDAEVAPRPNGRAPSPSAGACFASPVGGEILVRGRKLVGSAQVREGEAFLQHGSILLENGQAMVAQVSRVAAPDVAATSLTEALGQPVDPREVSEAIVAECRAAWRAEWRPSPATCSPADLARYRDSAWTWRR